MKKILFRAFILCTLIPSIWLSAANAVSEDAECLSLTTEAGATFSVCLEGDVSKAKLTNKTKSQLLELAHQLKKGAVQPSTAKARLNYGGNYPGYSTPTPPAAVVPITPDYSDYYPVITTPTVTETPDYTDYYPDNSVTPEVNEPDPYDMCAMYPSYPGCSS